MLRIGPTTHAANRHTGPWGLADPSQAPTIEWIEKSQPISTHYYSAEDYRDKATRVFAYYGVPKGASAENKKPAMVLVQRLWRHRLQGMGREIWVERGYAAIAMDLAGKGAGRQALPDGGPDQTRRQKFDDLAGASRTRGLTMPSPMSFARPPYCSTNPKSIPSGSA